MNAAFFVKASKSEGRLLGGRGCCLREGRWSGGAHGGRALRRFFGDDVSFFVPREEPEDGGDNEEADGYEDRFFHGENLANESVHGED